MKSLSFVILAALSLAGSLHAAEPMSQSSGATGRAKLFCGDPTETVSATSRSANPAQAPLSEIEAIHLLDLLNQGDVNSLTNIPGIAEQRAQLIIAARPLKTLDDLGLLRGFGPATVNAILSHAREL
jgi:DNA uptake protein ComE-like DNA-binding protein